MASEGEGRPIVVVDLDGTLANVEHRRPLIQGKHRDYERFHARCVDDPPNAWCVTLVNALRAAGFEIRIVSGRPVTVLAQTREWLSRAFPGAPELSVELLRASGDSTPDVELKRRWLGGIDKTRVAFCVDDRKRVVDMWRAEGLVCLQCDDWEERDAAERRHARPN
jgi:hypothetical protein